MASVLLQAGHSGGYAPYTSGGGGAPGEALWTTDLATRLTKRLRAAGVTVTVVGAWLVYQNGLPSILEPPAELAQDYDLFVALHYDAAIYGAGHNTGCFAGRAALDPCGAQSDKAIAAWNAVYPQATGIPLHSERLNANVTDYYAFRATSPRTPGYLIEHGVGQGDDHATLFERIDAVADADAQAILAYLGLQEQEMPLSDDDKQILDEVHALGANAGSIVQWIQLIGALQAQLATAQQPAPLLEKVAKVTLTYEDGSTQDLAAQPAPAATAAS